MRTLFNVEAQALLDAAGDAIDGLDPRSDSSPDPQVQSLIDGSRGFFLGSARPRGVYQSIGIDEFAEVFRGDGDNDDDTPLELVLEDAISLALFAVTLGEEVSQHINELFTGNDAAQGYVLDQVASIAADQLVEIARYRYAAESSRAGAAVLPYSPGYCGWNVTGQRALFARLEPADLGISLNESCLMYPIKSVSGVLVEAPIDAHDFSPSFPCCAVCTTMSCEKRIAALREETASA